jgi:hypothetical protein
MGNKTFSIVILNRTNYLQVVLQFKMQAGTLTTVASIGREKGLSSRLSLKLFRKD